MPHPFPKPKAPMPRIRLALCLTLIAAPAWADYPETLRDHILPGYAAFAAATADLAAAAQADCTAEALRPAYHAAFDAWQGVAHLRLGPVEEDGRDRIIAYWPDPKGLGQTQQDALLSGDPAALEPAAFAKASIAARGLFGMERLLYPVAPTVPPCALIRATATDLARIAAVVDAEWQIGYADAMLTPGATPDAPFQTGPDVRQALFTQLAFGLEKLADQQLGRPLGQPSLPHPDRAQALASGRSLRNVLLSLQAMRAMVETLTPDAPQTIAAFDRAITLAEKLEDPIFAGVATPSGRLKVEILQQAIQRTREIVGDELARELDTDISLNAGDGD